MSITAPRPSGIDSFEAAEEKAKLQKHFGRADIFFFLVCAWSASTASARWRRRVVPGSPG